MMAIIFVTCTYRKLVLLYTYILIHDNKIAAYFRTKLVSTGNMTTISNNNKTKINKAMKK